MTQQTGCLLDCDYAMSAADYVVGNAEGLTRGSASAPGCLSWALTLALAEIAGNQRATEPELATQSFDVKERENKQRTGLGVALQAQSRGFVREMHCERLCDPELPGGLYLVENLVLGYQDQNRTAQHCNHAESPVAPRCVVSGASPGS